MKTILVDDEPHNTALLSLHLLQWCPQITIIDICNDPIKAYESIELKQPDLVFMDIKMPGMTGLELMNKFSPLHFNVIFLTAYDQFVFNAFEYRAIDYLLKPISPDDLIKAVKRIVLNDQKTVITPIPKIAKVAFSTIQGYYFTNVNEIICCESNRNYTYIHVVTGNKILISKTLKIVESTLSQFDFFRANQSFLINMNHVKKFNRTPGRVTMVNDVTITISKKRDEFFERFYKV